MELLAVDIFGIFTWFRLVERFVTLFFSFSRMFGYAQLHLTHADIFRG